MNKSEMFLDITNRILEQLEKGNLIWKKTWTTGLPQNFITKKVYRGINYLFLLFQDFPSQYYLTFLQAKEKGLIITKGSKGFPVVFWKILEDAHHDENGKLKIDKTPFMRVSHVFNLAQTNGYEEKKPTLLVPKNMIDKFLIEHQIDFRKNLTSCCFSPKQDFISVPAFEQFQNEEEYHASIFHELIHWTGHEKRLARNMNHDSEDYAKEELIAELGASFLCGLCGINSATIQNNSAYIQGWIKQGKLDKSFIPHAAAEAQRAIDFLLKINHEEAEQ